MSSVLKTRPNSPSGEMFLKTKEVNKSSNYKSICTEIKAHLKNSVGNINNINHVTG